MGEQDIISNLIKYMREREVWFTTKNDPTYIEPKSYYELDKYGDPTEKALKKIVKEVQDYIGNGAVDLGDAIYMWTQEALNDYRINWVENLVTNFETKPVVPGLDAKEAVYQLTESLDNKTIIDTLNKLCKEYSPYKDNNEEIQQQVEQILEDAPDGTEMYRVSKETSSGWTAYGSYSDERTVLNPYIKTNGKWKMNGRTKSDMHDAMLGILFNSGKFMSREEAEKEKEEQSVNDKSYHRNIVNVGKDSAGNDVGSSTNRVDYPNRKTENKEEPLSIEEFRKTEYCKARCMDLARSRGCFEDIFEFMTDPEGDEAVERFYKDYLKYYEQGKLDKNAKEIKTEGVVHRLREENKKSQQAINDKITDPNFDSESKDGQIVIRTQELFNTLSDKGYDVQVSFDNGESQSTILLGQQGGRVLITITDTNTPLRAFADGSFELTEANMDIMKDLTSLIDGAI